MKSCSRVLVRVVVCTVVCLLVGTRGLWAQMGPAQAVVNKAATVKLGPAPNSPECITVGVERGDPAQGPSVLLVRFAAGCSAPWHWHTPNEHLMIVSGAFQMQMKDDQPTVLHHGDFVLAPSHHVHQAKCVGSAPCLLFLYSDASFDIHYVDAAGSEIPLSEAMKAAGSVKGGK